MLDRLLDGPLAWTAATLPAGAGRMILDDACLAELDAAVALMRANPLPTLALRPRDFRLDACHDFMNHVKDALDGGPGFVVLDRLPVERFTRDEAVRLYWLLASMLARPVAQKWDGTMIYDVHDTGQAPGNGVRPDLTNYEQSFHTDNSYNLCPPEYVGLFCLGVAREGGVHRVVSFLTAHNEMLRRHPSLLARLYRAFYFDRQREHAPDDVPVTHHPLFEWDGGRLTARLSRYQVINGQKLAGEPLDAEGEAALEALDRVMSEPSIAWEHEFRVGQIQFVNNRQLGHKRTAFRDWPEPERRRHLVRLWLRDAGRAFYNG